MTKLLPEGYEVLKPRRNTRRSRADPRWKPKLDLTLAQYAHLGVVIEGLPTHVKYRFSEAESWAQLHYVRTTSQATTMAQDVNQFNLLHLNDSVEFEVAPV